MSIATSTIAAIRFGYGLRPGEAPPAGAAALLDQLSRPETTDRSAAFADRARQIGKLRAARREMGRDAGEALKPMRQRLVAMAAEDALAKIGAALTSRTGFHERLHQFWCDHFTVAAKSPAVAALIARHEEQAIRPHVGGRFADMLKAAVSSPAMLAYLDQAGSVGPNSPAGRRRDRGLNENLAREVLELHTMGVGAGYSQGDVREFARLLTGFSADAEGFRFRPRIAEPGPKTVLGRSYGGGAPDPAPVHEFLEDLAQRPETAAHLSRKLAVHFVADDPPAGLVASMTEAWRAADGRLPAVCAAMLAHPASWSTFGAKVKQPYDFLISCLRALDLSAANLDRGARRANPLFGALAQMNQPIFRPRGPDGWPEAAEAWVTPQGLAARMGVATALGRRFGDRLDPRALARDSLRDALGRETEFAVSAASEKWEGVALLFA